MQTNVEITLFSDSPAGIAPKKYTAQTVEITHQKDIILTGVDGIESRGCLPSTIGWLGGAESDLKGITDVNILDSRGAILVNGALNSHYRWPQEADGWLTFDILRS